MVIEIVRDEFGFEYNVKTSHMPFLQCVQSSGVNYMAIEILDMVERYLESI